MVTTKRYFRALAISVATLGLSSCGGNEAPDTEPQQAATDQGAADIGAALRDRPDLSISADALAQTGLGTVFNGNASYTMIAPVDAAYGKLGDAVDSLSAPDRRAALAALLRDHILPGYLTPQDIGKAIDTTSGKQVKMQTVGTGELTFSRNGGSIIVTSSDGVSGKLMEQPATGGSSIVLPIDTVLKKL